MNTHQKLSELSDPVGIPLNTQVYNGGIPGEALWREEISLYFDKRRKLR
jgi:hypothetical protein